MSEDESKQLLDSIVGDASRRDVLKTGALATAGAGIATGAATAQEEDGDLFEDNDEAVEDDPVEGVDQVRIAMFQNDFVGGARFMITSGIIEWTPNVPVNLGGPFTGFNTHFATFLNTAGRFPVFVRQGENLGAEFDEDAGFFVDNEEGEGELDGGENGGGDGGGFNQPALYELDNQFSLYEGTDQIVTAYAFPLEQNIEDQVFAAEGIENQEDVNDFLF